MFANQLSVGDLLASRTITVSELHSVTSDLVLVSGTDWHTHQDREYLIHTSEDLSVWE